MIWLCYNCEVQVEVWMCVIVLTVCVILGPWIFCFTIASRGSFFYVSLNCGCWPISLCCVHMIHQFCALSTNTLGWFTCCVWLLLTKHTLMTRCYSLGLVFCLLSTAIIRDAFIIWVGEFELGLYFMFLRELDVTKS